MFFLYIFLFFFISVLIGRYQHLKKNYLQHLDFCGRHIQRHTSTHKYKRARSLPFVSIFFSLACFCVNGRPFVESNLHCVFFYDDQSVLYNLYQIDINCCGLFISVRAVKILLHTPNYKIALWLYHKPWQQMCAHKMNSPPTTDKKKEEAGVDAHLCASRSECKQKGRHMKWK